MPALVHTDRYGVSCSGNLSELPEGIHRMKDSSLLGKQSVNLHGEMSMIRSRWFSRIIP